MECLIGLSRPSNHWNMRDEILRWHCSRAGIYFWPLNELIENVKYFMPLLKQSNHWNMRDEILRWHWSRAGIYLWPLVIWGEDATSRWNPYSMSWKFNFYISKSMEKTKFKTECFWWTYRLLSVACPRPSLILAREKKKKRKWLVIGKV